MKSLTAVLIAIFATTSLFAQNIIDDQFSQYKVLENFTNVQVSSKMFELAGYIEFDESDEDLSELKEMISTIDAFQLIAGRALENPMPMYKDALAKVSKSHEELMRVTDKEGKFSFFIDEKRGVVREIVGIGTTEQELIIFSFTGKMNLKQLGKMANKMQSDGVPFFNKLKEHKASEVNIYPNPVEGGDDMTIEMPDNLTGGQATVYDMKGQVMQSFDITSEKQTIPTRGLPSGSYVVEMRNEGVVLKKRMVVQSK